ncbi:MAG: hypothetical protein ABSA34_04000 [Candidatus Goldiibacteriota bacterium]|jgi:hypothetical protein
MAGNSKKEIKKQEKEAAAPKGPESIDRQVIDLDVNMFVLKSNSVLILPETPNIYLSPAKAKKLVADLEKAVKNSRDGVIIRFKGSINPRQENANDDGSMFLTRELSVSEIES